MMNDLRLYDRVRVWRLLRDADSYDGWRVNRRPPRGDEIGTFIDLLHNPGLPDHYIVESSDSLARRRRTLDAAERAQRSSNELVAERAG